MRHTPARTREVHCLAKSDAQKSGCNTLDESHQNENPKTVQIWDYTVEDNLNELIGITYINKMHLLFGNLSHKNSIVKHVWLGVVMG